LAAAKAGKHVFCEKPLEISVDRCQRMIDACKKAERQLGVAYRCQFEPHHLECIRIAREKEMGTIKVIESGFGFVIGDPNQWRLKKELAGGGALMDVGIYVLQATRYLTGEEPILVSATETKTDAKKFAEVDETISWTATFPSGATAHCSTTYNAFGMGRFRAHTERGWFGLDPAFNYGGLRGARSDGKPLSFPNVDQFATEIDEFARCILEKKPTTVPGEEGLQDVKILMAIYESVRTGKAVKVA
jgi:predicted dehydrogenase